jgi:hypothetical protein
VKRSPLPFVINLIAELVMALLTALVVGTMTGGEPSLVAGLVFGFVLWLGFVATTLSVNRRYKGFGWDLTLIDAVIGWFGSPAVA